MHQREKYSMRTVRRRRDAEFYAAKSMWEWGEWAGASAGWIYAVQEAEAPLVKIGLSVQSDIRSRLSALPRQFHVPLTVRGTIYVPQWAAKVERYIHWLLRDSRIQGEWFYLHMNQAILDDLAAQAVQQVNNSAHRERAKRADYLRRKAAKRQREGWTV
jgi:hypothetical protein